MKGFAMLGKGKVGWIDRDMPKAGPLDAILKPVAVAPCSSDIHVVCSGGTASGKNDVVLGHEAIGEVVEVGNLVTRFKKGDIVVVSTTTPDWLSINTQTGMSQHDHGPLSSFKFVSKKDGVFAEYFHVNQADANLALLPEGIKPEAALMIVDMMSTGFHAVELANIEFGDTVVVIGIGPVGLMAVAGARQRGAGRIVGVGTRPNCISVAKQYGANDIISYKEGSIVDQVLAMTSGKGADRVIIAGGNAETFNQAVSMAKAGGVIANVNFFDYADVLSMPALAWGFGMANKDIRGGFCPGGAYRLEKLLELVKYGVVDPTKLISHTFKGFEKIEDAYNLMDTKTADVIKPVVII